MLQGRCPGPVVGPGASSDHRDVESAGSLGVGHEQHGVVPDDTHEAGWHGAPLDGGSRRGGELPRAGRDARPDGGGELVCVGAERAGPPVEQDVVRAWRPAYRTSWRAATDGRSSAPPSDGTFLRSGTLSRLSVDSVFGVFRGVVGQVDVVDGDVDLDDFQARHLFQG